ncbi:Polysaccharide lyase family 4, domain II [Singulisphaera sp. GP187]|uniref:carboxypeptidase regulatory-like domain-containing protein n=1 Tax=Singulisphaera sp. GP187 TaxID=1882752 RepID=UPI000926B7E6|nr:carboxypeptidase regulatory-like domain-containing protein [Singulisphaera sp. GP187]SIO67283.1 Polysaccharide lyase family 4, domain II [Singulisphaera sp. GP187]
MSHAWPRPSFIAGLGLAGALLLTISGCGGKGPETDDSVVIPDPTVAAPTAAPADGGAAPAPAATTAASSTSPAPTENVKAEGWGTLKGVITFEGTPPAPKDLVEKGKAPKDPEYCAKDQPIKTERLIVDAGSKGVKNVLVYIPKPTAVNPEAKSGAATAEVVFDQSKCIFEPHVLAVMTGAKILLKNSDPVNHNVNSKLKNNGTNPNVPPSSELPFVTQGGEKTPGEVVCDIHSWMKAYWMVTDSPYFAVTDEKGNFEIKNVPAGTQKVVVWQEAVTGSGFVTAPSGQAVTIAANGTGTLDLKIDAGKVRPE